VASYAPPTSENAYRLMRSQLSRQTGIYHLSLVEKMKKPIQRQDNCLLWKNMPACRKRCSPNSSWDCCMGA
jgi:hypothetical protein